MSASRTVSVSLSADTLDRAEAFARFEQRSVSDLMDEALRRYLIGDEEWDALLKETRAAGRAMGIHSEADIERLSDEYRREKQR